MQAYYSPQTYIKCVLVGGEGHGKNFLKSPADAHGFKMAKIPPLPCTFMPSTADLNDYLPYPETIHYEPFLELSFRARVQEFQFIRLFSEDNPRVAPGASILQIADALRIAGIDSL